VAGCQGTTRYPRAAYSFDAFERDASYGKAVKDALAIPSKTVGTTPTTGVVPFFISRSNTKRAVISERMVKNVADEVFGDGDLLASQVAKSFAADDGEFRGITKPFVYDKWCQSDGELRGVEEDVGGPLTVCDRNFYLLTYGTINAEFTGDLTSLTSHVDVAMGPTCRLCPLCGRSGAQCSRDNKCAMAHMPW
jgi:hypothetical protein